MTQYNKIAAFLSSMKVFLVALIFSFCMGHAYAMSERDAIEACPGPRLSEEVFNCTYPVPPINRWHAVYTADFAQKHNLPPENISTDLSHDIPYMEMDIQPFENWRNEQINGCIVNMLVKKPHDIALYSGERELTELPENRDLLHLIDINEHKHKLKPVISFNAASRDYDQEKTGFRSSTFAMYIKDAISGHDYFSANIPCRTITMHQERFPDNYAFWINKASVWGRYEMKHRNYDDPKTPKGKDFYNAHFFINIPQEIISTVFNDIQIGGLK